MTDRIEDVKEIMKAFDEWAFPEGSCWNFPKQNLSLRFDEVNTAIKIFKWFLSENKK